VLALFRPQRWGGGSHWLLGRAVHEGGSKGVDADSRGVWLLRTGLLLEHASVFAALFATLGSSGQSELGRATMRSARLSAQCSESGSQIRYCSLLAGWRVRYTVHGTVLEIL